MAKTSQKPGSCGIKSLQSWNIGCFENGDSASLLPPTPLRSRGAFGLWRQDGRNGGMCFVASVWCKLPEIYNGFVTDLATWTNWIICIFQHWKSFLRTMFAMYPWISSDSSRFFFGTLWKALRCTVWKACLWSNLPVFLAGEPERKGKKDELNL